MASSDVYLSFGAETGDLEAALARAQAEVKRTTAEMRTLASEMARTGSSMDSDMGSRLSSLGSKLTEAKESVSGFKDELKGVEGGGGFIAGLKEKVEGFLAPLNSAKLGLAEMGEAVAGAFAVEKIVEFVRSMGELGEQTERTSAIFGLSAEEVGALSYAFAVSGTNAESALKALERFQPALAQAQSGTGKVAEGLQALGLRAQDLIGLSLPEQLNRIADAVSSFADSTTKTAALQALGRNFVELLPLLDQGSEGFRRAKAAAEAAGVTFNDLTKDELKAMNTGLVDLGLSIEGVGIQGFLPFIDTVNGAIAVLRDLMQTFIDSIKNGGDVAQMLYLISDAIRVVVTGIAILIQTFKDMATIAAGALNSINDYFNGLGRTVRAFFTDLAHHDLTFSGMAAASAEANAKVKKDFEDMTTDVLKNGEILGEEFRKIWKGFGDEAEDAATRAKNAVGGVSAEGGGKPTAPAMREPTAMEKARAEVERLTAALQATTDALQGKKGLSYGLSDADRDRIIRTIAGEADSGNRESQEAVADVIRNRLLSPKGEYGRGVMEVTRADQFSAWNPSDPNFARISGMSPDSAAYKQIGDVVDKVFSGAVSDITHGASNYYAPAGMPGGRPPSWAAATEAIQETTIGTQRFSGRVAGLPEAPTGAPPTGEEQAKLLALQKDQTLELEKARQKVLDINTEEAGGTETAKEKLKIAEEDAKQKGDAVAHAKELLGAAEKDLAAAEKAGVTEERKIKLREEVAKATEAVTAAQLKQEESGKRLEIAQAKASGDIEKEKAAELALADIKIKAAGSDVAALQTAQAEKLAIETRYAEQSKSLAMQKANEEIAAARTAAANKIKDIDLEFRAKQISESQKVAMTKAALAEEIATERSILQQELQLDGLRPPERQKILAQLAAAEEKYAQQVKETQLKAAEDSAKAWQSMADKIAGVLNSQVDGIISGTTTMKQAFSNMAKSIIEDVVKYAIKWAVEHAFAATSVMAMNQTVTASTLAGNAAIAASQTASGAAGIATQAANATASIGIDAAKTFGGVFGFLAPLLGPFAAGPAAGAEATVLAAGAAFDVGAWDLPRDMIAAVHRGEMVIPSRGGVADEFRNFMSDGGFNRAGTAGVGAPAGGSKSVHISPTTNLHVSTMDGASFSSFINANHKTLLSAVDRAVRHGAGLGLRTFTP
jgi:phage-related protein